MQFSSRDGGSPASLRSDRLLIAALSALLLMVLVWTSALAAPTPGGAEREKPATPAATPEPPYYATWLKDPRSLGFKPDSRLFSIVQRMVMSQHFEKPTAEKLYEGVAKEVGLLLKEARVSPDGLKALTRDRSLPQEIEKRYAGKVDRGLLWFAMIRGLLEGTGDPYSVLMPPKEFDMMMSRLRDESFGGVGIVIELDKDNKNYLTVVEPLEGTPAARAGLQAGDVILQIDGKSTQEMPIDSAVASIRGPIGSKVVLTIQRGGEARRDYAITRGTIKVTSVSSKMLPGNLGYIRLRVFGETTSAEFARAIETLTGEGARGLIVDVRNNGGGFLTAATEICSHFIPEGQIVTMTRNRSGDRRDEISTSGHKRVEVPVVLLVNNYSASASEITAGCLKDNKAATLVGVKTFGKGSVQQLFPLPDEAALKVTVAHFFTPQGHEINKVGVQPDVKVEMEPKYVGNATKDLQMQKAIELLNQRASVSH